MKRPTKPKLQKLVRELAQHIVDLNNYTAQPLARMCWCGTGCCMNSVACQNTKRLMRRYRKLMGPVPKVTDLFA